MTRPPIVEKVEDVKGLYQPAVAGEC